MASLTIYLLRVRTMKAANLENELPVAIFHCYATVLMDIAQVSGVLYFTITY